MAYEIIVADPIDACTDYTVGTARNADMSVCLFEDAHGHHTSRTCKQCPQQVHSIDMAHPLKWPKLAPRPAVFEAGRR